MPTASTVLLGVSGQEGRRLPALGQDAPSHAALMEMICPRALSPGPLLCVPGLWVRVPQETDGHSNRMLPGVLLTEAGQGVGQP